MKPPKHNVDLMRLKELIDQGLSSRQCAKEIGCSSTNIRYWAKKKAWKWSFIRTRKDRTKDCICRFCGKDYNDNKRSLGGHSVNCKSNPNRKSNLRGFRGSHTKESKLKISSKRKEYLEKSKKNHNWSLCHGRQSDPELKFQTVLEELRIEYCPEYTPEESKRFYRIDFAILNGKIGFEINGNQHYTDATRGKLKKYYLERQKYLESLGWTMINIHYSLAYDKNKILEILTENRLIAPVSQRIEKLPSKQNVVGSNPTGSARNF